MREVKGPFFLEIRLKEAGSESRRAYDNIYEETGLSQIESFYLWLIDHLHLSGSGYLLDVSCGSGELVRLAAQRGLKSYGVDISEVAARTAYKNTRPVGLIAVSTGENLPFPPGHFDYVTSIGSLEHYIEPDEAVRNMARVLKLGGKAFILVPNTFSLLTNVWAAFRGGYTSVDDQPIQRYGARLDWTCLLESNGFAVVETIKYERPWPRQASDWGYYLRRPKEMLRLMAVPFVPLNLAFCFLFVCERRQTSVG